MTLKRRLSIRAGRMWWQQPCAGTPAALWWQRIRRRERETGTFSFSSFDSVHGMVLMAFGTSLTPLEILALLVTLPGNAPDAQR